MGACTRLDARQRCDGWRGRGIESLVVNGVLIDFLTAQTDLVVDSFHGM